MLPRLPALVVPVALIPWVIALVSFAEQSAEQNSNTLSPLGTLLLIVPPVLVGAIALWRFADHGVLPDGALLKGETTASSALLSADAA